MSLTKIAINTTWLKNRAIVAGAGALMGGSLGFATTGSTKGTMVGAAMGAPTLLGVSHITRGLRTQAWREALGKIQKEIDEVAKTRTKIKETPLLKRDVRDILKDFGLKKKEKFMNKQLNRLSKNINYVKNEALF